MTPAAPLNDYERPSVAVDTAVLTATTRDLFVVLTAAHGDLRLPGTFLHASETLIEAVHRSLEQKTGMRGLDPQQLHVFDDPRRDDRGWVLSVAHLDVVTEDQVALASGAVLVPLREAVGLPFDHDRIVELAVDRLRAEYLRVADPRRLLPEPFTLRDLQQLHEAIAGEALRRETFRKRMEPQLIPTDDRLSGVIGKPPRLYRRPEHRKR